MALEKEIWLSPLPGYLQITILLLVQSITAEFVK